MICPICWRDPDKTETRYTPDGTPYKVSGHKCNCVRERGVRVAVGVCCGRELGRELLLAEDLADAQRGRGCA